MVAYCDAQHGTADDARNTGIDTAGELWCGRSSAQALGSVPQLFALAACNAGAVPGEGPSSARLMLVGEQPGDQEDLAGRPFVGPAGQLLDRALAAAGIERAQVYVTNAVKHFKYELRGKRRLHKKPAEQEIAACHAWYESEVAAVQPALIVALGATAVRAVLGRALPILAHRGTLIEAPNDLAPSARVLVTVHPSYLLRVPPETRDAEFGKFVKTCRLQRNTSATSADAAGD